MIDSNQPDNPYSIPGTARWLGYLGLIPFIVLSIGIASGIDFKWLGLMSARQALLAYAAIIITFIGAVHWGIALGGSTGKGDVAGTDRQSVQDENTHYVYSVIPSLVAWGLLFLPVKASLVGMAVVLVILYAVDRHLLKSFHPTGYQTLRLHLTTVAGLSLALSGLTLT